MKQFFDEAALQDHPLRVLQEFLKEEQANEEAKKYDALRFVGYVLEIGYDTVTIITSDPFKLAVGGVPRNSMLIMVPASLENLPPHFTLLRVLESAETPLSRETQQTYFELQKKSMPELDVFTQGELQWGALRTGVLGMFYPNPDETNRVEFSGDLNNFVSAHKYKVFSPTDDLLWLIVNSMVPDSNRFEIGRLRLTECRLQTPGQPLPNVPIYVSTKDFMGARTAMFGKTRLGKSNIVKLIAQSLIETTVDDRNVGQLIFDINGEYANDNPQDNSRSIASAFPDRCQVYALTPKPATPSKPLKLNFYEHPDRSLKVLADLLESEGRTAIYVKSFVGADLASIDDLAAMPPNEQLRARRRILIYWAILRKAGYDADEGALKAAVKIDPQFSAGLRNAAYGGTAPAAVSSLATLLTEFEKIADFVRGRDSNDPLLVSQSGNPLFEADERALLDFLKPSAGAGPKMIQRFRLYHDKDAGNFTKEILALLDKGQTVILDLGNANPEVMSYFSDELSRAVLIHQVDKFSNNKLGEVFIQVYFEEAHNLFPARDDTTVDIYRRLAKEGAKYQIGMVYATQSVTTVSKDLLGQTENFFIVHLSSRDEVTALAKVNVAYDSLKDDILMTKTPGYVRMLSRSHRFVIPVQALKFVPLDPGVESEPTSEGELVSAVHGG